ERAGLVRVGGGGSEAQTREGEEETEGQTERVSQDILLAAPGIIAVRRVRRKRGAAVAARALRARPRAPGGRPRRPARRCPCGGRSRASRSGTPPDAAPCRSSPLLAVQPAPPPP